MGAHEGRAVDVIPVAPYGGGLPSQARDAPHADDLATLLVRKWKLSVEQTADILIPVISALAAAHDAGTVHGALNPRNIVLSPRDPDLVPDVIGFGTAKAPEQFVQRTGLQPPLGVRLYASPEQASGDREADPRSDQFALGVVLYECLTGQPPFEAGSTQGVIAQVVDCKYKKPRELEPSIPRALEAIIARTLRKRPEDRFANMRGLGAALLPFASRRVQVAYVGQMGLGLTSRRGAQARTEGSRADQGVSTKAHATEAASSTSNRRRGVLGAVAAALIVAVLVMLATRRNDEPAVGTATHATASPAPARPAADEASMPSPRPERARPATAAVRTAPAAPTLAPRTYQVDLRVEPRTAWIMLDRKAAGSGRLQRALPIDGTTHELRVGAPGYKARILLFKDALPPQSLVLERRSKQPAPAKGRSARME